MKVIEHILKATEPTFSCEIVPPPRGKSAQEIIDTVETLAAAKLAWIDVTSHSSMAYYQEKTDGTLERRIYKKRPGTLGICGIIQNRFRVDTVAHILCKGFSKEETEDALIELHYLGIHNILALRGDGPNYDREISKNHQINAYAADLVRQATDLRNGKFIEETGTCESLDFCVGVAGYPEKHFESPNLSMDLKYLKEKVDAGADYIVTQMFFDNAKYFEFEKACRQAGINVPIVPGLKIIKSARQIATLPKTFNVDIPAQLCEEIQKNPAHAEEIGMKWAAKQSRELLERGAAGIHFYVMNDASQVVNIFKSLRT